MSVFKATSPEAEAAFRQLEERRSATAENALRVADEQIAGVRARGDAFVAEQIAKFDRVTLAPSEILQPTIDNRETAADLTSAIELAIARIESFHLPQLPTSYRCGTLTHRVRPLRRVGIYVPGGRAVYISTLIMCAVPARIAGVRELVVATTPSAAARPELQYACQRLGITAIYRAGGAAGIAAMALGTETLERVDKIVGPGNAYVTAAKARLIGEVGIDMTAGPTELVVIADDTANAEYVIADLLAQAEHGEDSAVICLTTDETLARAMPPRAITFLVASIDEALAISDRLAPEHLSIQTRYATDVAERAQNAGAVFCGAFSPVAAGDYTAGPNHVLPTAGSARFFSPLGVYDFVKRSNIVALTSDELQTIAPATATLANFEGLPNHARSVQSRFEVKA
jgi:histidinol dehydrogenase